MFVLINSFLIRKGFTGMAIWPFVLVKNKKLKEDKAFMNHERIHLRQQLEMLIVPFFVWYGIEYLVRIFQYRNRFEAYRNISFEREAYAMEGNFDYLKDRGFWSFTNYFLEEK